MMKRYRNFVRTKSRYRFVTLMQEVCGSWAGRRVGGGVLWWEVGDVDRVVLGNGELGTVEGDKWGQGDVAGVVETQLYRVVRFGHGEYQLENRSAEKGREAKARANEARLEREWQNVDDAASFLVELGRRAAVDEWEQGRVAEIAQKGERRRHEHRREGAAAVSRTLDRGETLTAIAELAGIKVS